MAAFPADLWIVDAIIALVAVEGVVLVLWRALTGGGLTMAETLANLSSGAALLLALRMAITGGLSASVLAFLSVALIAHVADLASRWEAGWARRPQGSPVASTSFIRHGHGDRPKAVKVKAIRFCRGRALL
jgi:hypothetical protein